MISKVTASSSHQSFIKIFEPSKLTKIALAALGLLLLGLAVAVIRRKYSSHPVDEKQRLDASNYPVDVVQMLGGPEKFNSLPIISRKNFADSSRHYSLGTLCDSLEKKFHESFDAIPIKKGLDDWGNPFLVIYISGRPEFNIPENSPHSNFQKILLESRPLTVEKQKFYFFSMEDTRKELVWHWGSVGFESLKAAEFCYNNLSAFIFYAQGNSVVSL